MDLRHTFHVPTSVSETWDHFNDIASVAQCFPGAQVTSVEGDTFNGTVKVKLGPIALQYNGTGTFIEKDESERRLVVAAKGKDKRGNGTAGANVTLTMAEPDGGGTDVDVVTDLNVTGKPAQFGRGVMQDVSDKLLGQFVTCLGHRLGASGPDQPGENASVEKPPTPLEQTSDAQGAPLGSHADSAGLAGSAEVTAPPPTESVAEPVEPRSENPAPVAPDDALDLGSTVLPVIARMYWKHAVVGLLGVLIVWRLIRRLR